MHRIKLQNLVIHCIIGRLAHERCNLQKVVVAADVQLGSNKAAKSGNLRDTIDYARLAEEIAFILKSTRFYLLESAVDTLARYICTLYSHYAVKAEVSISKPDVLANAVPQATIELASDEVDPQRTASDFGYVDTVQETKQCGVYILGITPQNSITTHYHVKTREHEMILTNELHLQGQPISIGTSISWPPYFPHRYDNWSDKTQKILCIDEPAFQKEDEVVTNCHDLRMP